ncbi:MAG: ABC transporter substrate-binding protein [Clostridia bacterium]
MGKKLVLLMLVLALLCGTSALGAPFTDSLGRTVDMPDEVSRVAVSGPLAQITLFALAPDALVGLSSAWDASATEFIGKYSGLPLLGQLYGGKGEMNLEEVIASQAQVIIDVGEPKKSAKADLDDLQAQVGIPFIHITMTTETAGDAFRQLGALLDRGQAAETLATYCEDTYARVQAIMDKVGEKRVRVLYCLGDAGLNVIAKGSYHAEVIDMISDNVAVVAEPTSKGTGNEVDMEQIMLWNPDFIVFAKDSIYDTVQEDPAWQSLPAIAKGRYVEAPFGPYNWMGFPPSVQRYLGMLWLEQVLYPELADYDLYEEAANYFDLFYHCTLTRAQFDRLTQDAFPR